MPFDRDAEANELAPKIELVFDSGRAAASDLPMPPSAYLCLGWWNTSDDGRTMITSRATSFEELKGQVDEIKAALDARLVEARARFAAVTA